jgi:hypothetical protein
MNADEEFGVIKNHFPVGVHHYLSAANVARVVANNKKPFTNNVFLLCRHRAVEGNELQTAVRVGRPHHLGENLDRMFLVHAEVQLDDGMHREGARGMDEHAARADIAGTAFFGAPEAPPGSVMIFLAPDFHFALETTALVEAFFCGGVAHFRDVFLHG